MLKKHLLVIGGTLSLLMGVIGMLLPVLPTTPFLLLAAFCYVRGSRRMYLWLMNHRFLGTYIRNYTQYHAVSRNVKIGSLITLWASLSISIAVIGSTVVRLILVAVGIGVSIHLLTLKTMPRDAQEGAPAAPMDLEAEKD